MNDQPPQPPRFQFSLSALLFWVLWFGFCGAVVAGFERPNSDLGIVGMLYGVLLLVALLVAQSEWNKRHSDES